MPPINKKNGPTFPRGKSKAKVGPVWRGPCDLGPNGGVTQSMLSNFLVCRERFRLRYVEGLRSADAFNPRMEYGNMWHACEEALAARKDWREGLDAYVQVVAAKYPLDRALVDKWQMACRTQFPVYVDYWAKHPDVEERTPLLQEAVFDVPYSLPSGRKIRLRGKFDAVDLIGKGKAMGVYLQENKTKSDIDEQQLRLQLQFDLQTMFYLRALQGYHWNAEKSKDPIKAWGIHPIRGVRYNVIRRPLSGGEGSITQKKGSKNVKPETDEEYWARLRGVFDGTGINSKGENYTGPSFWFMRWKVEVTPHEIRQFEHRFLHPILEQLCDWYDHVTSGDPFRTFVKVDGSNAEDQSAIHWQHPFGVYNSMNEGGSTDYDNVLATGNTVGLVRRESLFEELK